LVVGYSKKKIIVYHDPTDAVGVGIYNVGVVVVCGGGAVVSGLDASVSLLIFSCGMSLAISCLFI
jgi:hypothetical protein